MCLPSKPLHVFKAQPQHGPFVLWLEEVCMKDYATALWGNWRPSSTLAKLDLSTHEMVALDGELVGCFATRIENDMLHLTKLYMAPEARNRGIGSQVLQKVIARAERQSLQVQLGVLTTNPALRFYERHGFAVHHETSERRLMIRPPSSQQSGAKP